MTQFLKEQRVRDFRLRIRQNFFTEGQFRRISCTVKKTFAVISPPYKNPANALGSLHPQVGPKVNEDTLSDFHKPLLRSIGPGKLKNSHPTATTHGSIQIVPDFPVYISELDNIQQKFQVEFDGLNKDHPSFIDKKYRERREYIGSIALDYKMGQSIPRVEYTNEEDNLWQLVYTTLRPLLEADANQEYIQNLKLIEREGVFRPERVPQLEDINQFLIARNNWRIKPVNGILSQRQFLNCLAFRTFPSSQYLRHPNRPFYTPEPDIFHEYLGHIPNFCDKDYCDISQLFGLLSLGADDHTIKVLSSVYWYLIEFGTCLENGVMKFFGAGLAGSVDEINNFRSCRDFRKLDVSVSMPPIELIVQDVQPFFYFIDRYSDYIEQMLIFAKSIKKPFTVAPNEESTIMFVNMNVTTFEPGVDGAISI